MKNIYKTFCKNFKSFGSNLFVLVYMVTASDYMVQKYFFFLLIRKPAGDSWFEWADLKFNFLFPFSDKI